MTHLQFIFMFFFLQLYPYPIHIHSVYRIDIIVIGISLNEYIRVPQRNFSGIAVWFTGEVFLVVEYIFSIKTVKLFGLAANLNPQFYRLFFQLRQLFRKFVERNP